MAGEVVVLRGVGAKGFEASRAMRRAIDDQIGGIVAIQHVRQGVAILPGVDREDVVLSFRCEKDSSMSQQVCRMPVIASAAVS